MSITKKVEISSAILAAALITTGCSSSSSDSSQGPLTQAGIFTLDEFDGGAFGSNFLIAGFYDLAGDISPLLPLLETPTSDRCVINGELTAEEQEGNELFNAGVLVSAGDALVLSSPLGTFATMEKRTDEGDIFYTSSDMLDNIPTEMTLDIPGDDFPAFANIAIPESVSIDDFAFAADVVTESSEYTWTSTGAADTTVLLDIMFGSTLIECQVIDDGSFSLPAETVAQTGELTDGSVIYASVDSRVQAQSGEALLLVTRSKEILLP